MNAGPIYHILDRSQLRLNSIIISTHAFKIMLLTAGAAGLFIAVAHWFGWPGANLLCWLLLTISGGLAGLIYGWSRRLNYATTAHWLDEQFHDYEAITAALICLERGCNGSLDRAVVERAVTLTSAPPVLRWPVRNLWRQAVICGGTCLGIFLLLGLELHFGQVLRQTAFSNSIKPPQNTVERIDQGRRKTPPQTPGEIAQLLFPQDPQMAQQAEMAFREGDLDTVKSLLKKSAMNYEDNINQNTDLSQEQRREREQERSQLMQKMARYIADSQQNADNSKTRNKPANSTQPNDAGNRTDNVKNRPGKFGPTNPDSVSQMYEEMSKAMRNNYYAQDSQRGNGSGKKAGPLTRAFQNKGAWGNVKTDLNLPKATISRNKDKPVLEYVLPGKDSRVPVMQILPDLSRAAEAAVARQGVPGEYQDFLRFYFMELTQKIKGATPENGVPK